MTEPGPHEFKSSYSGMVCAAMVLDAEGFGDSCGKPASDPVHDIDAEAVDQGRRSWFLDYEEAEKRRLDAEAKAAAEAQAAAEADPERQAEEDARGWQELWRGLHARAWPWR